MKKFLILLLLIFICLPVAALATCAPDQDTCPVTSGEVLGVQVVPLIAKATGDEVYLVNEEITLSASASQIPDLGSNGRVEYWWNFGDLSAPVAGETVTHKYSKTGDYQVALVIKTATATAEDDLAIRVTDRAIFMITSSDLDQVAVNNFLNYAKRLDYLVYTLPVDETAQDLIVEDQLINQLLEHREQLARSAILVGWTKNNYEINAFIRLRQHLTAADFFAKKSLVIVATNPGLVSRRVQPVYDSLRPENALVIKPELLTRVVDGASRGELISSVQDERSGFVLLGIHSRRNFGSVTFYNFISHFINHLINQGVHPATILLLLMIPLVTTALAFSRQVLGIKSLGIYIPTVLTLTFVSLGLSAGLLLLVYILLVGTGARIILKRLRLLYVPRMSLLISLVGVAVLALFYISVRVPQLGMLSVSVFPILILIMLVEEFVKVQIEEGARSAFRLTLETIALSVACFGIVNSQVVRNFLMSYPEMILICFFINYLLGKWSGLRLLEYVRFREVIKVMARRNAKNGKNDKKPV